MRCTLIRACPRLYILLRHKNRYFTDVKFIQKNICCPNDKKRKYRYKTK
ncbi:hypothetical protein EXW39_21785 [Bacillus mycoides]|uniref:Clip domain-containing protein n=1 Tax=Bacillus mycoides TaxID=1405 RepID=A0A4V5TN41_BACMY|nr:hypothetical protein [Bacillus mycoides]TXR84820.1 hypothetical protein DN408_10755 [Bacillus sp. AR13-1]MBE7146513.1 hypothetical protein [Bacillus mycoides]MCZ6939575.1 hypothetical protein [Bacillus mycoides]MDR4238864.1 hypothetical protein [Bacillus mycoides]